MKRSLSLNPPVRIALAVVASAIVAIAADMIGFGVCVNAGLCGGHGGEGFGMVIVAVGLPVFILMLYLLVRRLLMSDRAGQKSSRRLPH